MAKGNPDYVSLHVAIYASTLTVGPDGSFFGTENFYPGTIFNVTLGGLFHRLIEFNDDNGSEASGGPLLALPDGSFLGSTMCGGKSGRSSRWRWRRMGPFMA